MEAALEDCINFEFSWFLCYYHKRNTKPRRLEETGVSTKSQWLFISGISTGLRRITMHMAVLYFTGSWSDLLGRDPGDDCVLLKKN
jgi:hypothetical protein